MKIINIIEKLKDEIESTTESSKRDKRKSYIDYYEGAIDAFTHMLNGINKNKNKKD